MENSSVYFSEFGVAGYIRRLAKHTRNCELTKAQSRNPAIPVLSYLIFGSCELSFLSNKDGLDLGVGIDG